MFLCEEGELCFQGPMCILVVGGYWFHWTSHRWTNLNRWCISFLGIMIFQGTCQFVNCVSFSTIVCASLQVLLSSCLVYRSWNNIRSILLFCNNLCKLVFRRFANITILGAGLSTYVEVCLWVRVMIYWWFLWGIRIINKEMDNALRTPWKHKLHQGW